MAQQRKSFPNMDGVIAALDVPQPFLKKLKPCLSDWNRWIDLRDIGNAVLLGETLSLQRAGAESAAGKDSYLAGVACAIHWISLDHPLTPRAQLDFISKQNRSLQDMWARCFEFIRASHISGAWVECLRRGFETSAMTIAFRSNVANRRELSELVLLTELSAWTMSAREAVYNLLPLSKDKAFREAVIKMLYNDPDRYLRRIVREATSRGDIPINHELLNDKYPKGNPEESKVRWSEFRRMSVPDVLAEDKRNMLCDIVAADRFVREQMSMVESGAKANGGSLDLCRSSLNFWMEKRVEEESKTYLLLLKRVIDDLETFS